MTQYIRTTPDGFEVHAADHAFERHLHRDGHVTVVLAGGYLEASDQGRRRLQAGDVLIHEPFEAHANAIDRCGARMISRKLPMGQAHLWTQGRVRDLDSVMRLVEGGEQDVWALIVEDTRPGVDWAADWPDLLAAALRSEPNLPIARWAETNGLAPETVSRGFRLAYGVSPKRFRATNRARLALQRLMAGAAPCDVAYDLDFSDQAHLCRSIRDLTGRTPGDWFKSVQ